MAPKTFAMTRLLVALSLIAVAVPLGVAFQATADHGKPHEPLPCREASMAAFGDATAAGVTLQAQGQQVLLPVKLLQIAASTDGYITLDVKHRCVKAYHIVAVKDSQITGTTVEVDTWAYPNCGSGVDTYQLPVGNDVVHYDVYLEWYGCDGASGQDQRHFDVVDPVLPRLL